MWLLTNWRLTLMAFLALSLSASLLLNRHLLSALDEAKKDLTNCQTSITETKVLNEKLQSARDDTASQLSLLKRMRPNACVQLADPVKAGARPSSGNAQIAATTDDLYDYAATCRNYWVERQLLEESLNAR